MSSKCHDKRFTRQVKKLWLRDGFTIKTIKSSPSLGCAFPVHLQAAAGAPYSRLKSMIQHQSCGAQLTVKMFIIQLATQNRS